MGADDGNESPDESPGGVARRDAGAPIDPATLGGWFDAYGAALVLYARQWLDRGAAEDVVQDVFVRLMAQPGGQRPAHLRAWL